MSKGLSGQKESEKGEKEKVLLVPTIMVGDSQGCLHVLSLDDDFRNSTELVQKMKNETYFKEGKMLLIYWMHNSTLRVYYSSVIPCRANP